MKLQELIEERGRLIAECRALLNQVQKENRPTLTALERSSYDQRDQRIDQLDDLIAREQKQGGRDRQMEERGGPSAGRPDPTAGYLSHGSSEFETLDGQEIRTLQPGDSFRSLMLERCPLPDGMQPSELSWNRYVRALVTGDWRQAPAEARAMGTAPAVGGGYLLPAPLAGELIDLARAQSVLSRAGVRVVPMERGEVIMAKMTGDMTPKWKIENLTAPSESSPEFGKLTLTARTLIGYAVAGAELIADAPNVGAIIRDSLSQSLALELDRVGLRGSGVSPEPIGILNWAGINKINLATNPLTRYQDVSQGVQKILEKNGPEAGLAVIMAPRTWGEIDRYQDTTNQPLRPPASWERLNKLTTSQVPTNLGAGENETEIYLGWFNQLLLGMRLGIELLASREAGDAMKKYQVQFVGVLRADFVVAVDGHFTLIDGITPQA